MATGWAGHPACPPSASPQSSSSAPGLPSKGCSRSKEHLWGCLRALQEPPGGAILWPGVGENRSPCPVPLAPGTADAGGGRNKVGCLLQDLGAVVTNAHVHVIASARSSRPWAGPQGVIPIFQRASAG